jgi:DNA-binding SARP family transcriptional activator/predicted ATPase
MLFLSFLGPFGAGFQSKTPLLLRTRKAQALLIYLATEHALARRESARREVLMELLWPGMPDRSAQQNLRQTLYLLRRNLPSVENRNGATPVPFLLTDRETVAVNPGAVYKCDLADFQRLVAEGTVDAYEKMLALYRGDFLSDFHLDDSDEFEIWADSHRVQLRAQFLGALEWLAAHSLAERNYARAQSYARLQLERDRLGEKAHRQLMEALAWSGQRGRAIADYEGLVEALWHELGVEPSRETRELADAIRGGALDDRSTAVTVTYERPRRLPWPTTPLIGREPELEQLRARLLTADARLVSIVGPGGIGKTRLALEGALRFDERFSRGAAFAELASLETSEAIVMAIARALQFAVSGADTREVKTQILDYLRGQELLLVLDNFEHLLDGVSLLNEIMQTAPRVKLLVTSRERLRLQGEHVLALEGLPLSPWGTIADAAGDPIMQLFLYHAQRLRPSFALHQEDLSSLEAIFRFVSGVPLAVILAAGWVELMSPAEIAAEIGKSLDFLEAEYDDLPERQRSMRAVFASARQRLSEKEQDAFSALSAFRGGFTIKAAHAVAGASPQDVRRLVERSLLMRGMGGRLQIHELLRQFAAEQLARHPEQEQAIRERHSRYYCAFLQQREQDLRSVRSAEAEAAIALDFENLRLAWTWAADHSEPLVIQAQTGLGIFCKRQGRWNEAETAFLYVDAQISERESGDARRMAERLAWGSFFSGLHSPEVAETMMERAKACLARAAARGDDVRAERAFILLIESQLYSHTTAERVKLLEASLRLFQELDRLWEMAWVHDELGWLHMKQASYRLAQEQYVEVVRLSEMAGDQRYAVRAKIEIATNLAWLGQLAEAEELLREALARCEASDDEWGAVQAQWRLGEVLLFSGRFGETLSSLARSHAAGASRVRSLLVRLSDLHRCWTLLHLGQYDRVRQELQLLMADDKVRGYHRALGCFLEGSLALVLRQPEEARVHFEESAAILGPTGQPDETAWVYAGLGYAALHSGDHKTARGHLAEALRQGLFVPGMLALPAVALLLAKGGELARAVEVYSLASTYAFVANSSWFDHVAGRHINTVARTLEPEEVIAARSRGEGRDFLGTIDELLKPS